ncbi:signal recognition particle subunit SRP19 [Kwoniella heveanensis CBS 569]|nr:signal recognition particle subunit SRP19 [Kwoniella heveanensis CBS 569]
MPTVEDYFDDDTDLPLPSSSSRALPDTGLKGALLEEITSDDEGGLDFSKLAEQSRGVFGENAVAPPPSSTSTGTGKGKEVARGGAQDELRPSAPGGGAPKMDPNTPMGGFMGDMMKLQQAEDDRMERLRKQFGNANVASDPSVYKGWNTVYPLYFDAKVSIAEGRRVPRTSSVWWPQATQIAHACRVLGLPSVLEPDRCHPADWENPGRVKVQIMKEGRYLNPIVKNRTQLYKHISDQIRQRNPSLTYDASAASKRSSKAKAGKTTSASTSAVASGSRNKSKNQKQNQGSKSGKSLAVTKKGSATQPSKMTTQIKLPSRPPLAPQPIPALDDRLPLHSPAVPAGVAVAAMKRDIEAEKEAKKKGANNPLLGAGPGGGSGEGGAEGKDKMPKMKRVVVRGKR